MSRLRGGKSLAGVGGVLFLLAAVAAVRFFRADAPTARAEALAARAAGGPGVSRTPEQRREDLRLLRRELHRLSPRQRQAFWAGRRKVFREWLGQLARLPRVERAAVLDQEIDRMEDFRRTTAPGPVGPGVVAGTGWGAGLGPEELNRRRAIWLDMTTPDERAVVRQYFEMLARLRQQRGLPGTSSPWGDDSPT